MRPNIKKNLTLFTVILGLFLLFWWCLSQFIIYNDNRWFVLSSWRSVGSNQKFVVQKYTSGDGEVKYFFKKQSFLRGKIIELNGFEHTINECSGFQYSIDDQSSDLLCFSSLVGVHSQNLVLVETRDNNFNLIKFQTIDGIVSNLISDTPKIQLIDYNHDQLIDVIVHNRNYEQDPIKDNIASYYKNNGEMFVFDYNKAIIKEN